MLGVPYPVFTHAHLWLLVWIRPAHLSHFSREREMVLRDISREKSGARNCEKNEPNSGQFEAQFDQNLGNYQDKITSVQTVSTIPLKYHTLLSF